MKLHPSALGTVIARMREAEGVSQDELADQAGIHRTYVSQLERGLKSPTVNTLVSIANALNVRASEILRQLEEIDELSD